MFTRSTTGTGADPCAAFQFIRSPGSLCDRLGRARTRGRPPGGSCPRRHPTRGCTNDLGAANTRRRGRLRPPRAGRSHGTATRRGGGGNRRHAVSRRAAGRRIVRRRGRDRRRPAGVHGTGERRPARHRRGSSHQGMAEPPHVARPLHDGAGPPRCPCERRRGRRLGERAAARAVIRASLVHPATAGAAVRLCRYRRVRRSPRHGNGLPAVQRLRLLPAGGSRVVQGRLVLGGRSERRRPRCGRARQQRRRDREPGRAGS